jgi:hypothetical protein
MEISLIQSFQSEWIKKKRSLASWLVSVGGFFIPAILLIGRFYNFDGIAEVNAADNAWESLYSRCWQFMGLFLLPMGVILASSLITQIEFRNNSWKQLHASPLRFSTIFCSKLLVLLLMLLQFFVLFNAGVYLLGTIPALFFSSIPFPKQAFNASLLMKQNIPYLIACLPVVALQYLISLQFRNFLIPIGFGLGLLVASLIALNWKYGYTVPYSYCAYAFLGKKILSNPMVNTNYWALGYFIGIIVLAFVLYVNKRERG